MMNVVLDSPEKLSHNSSEFKLILSLHLDVGWTHTFIQWISHYGQPYKAAIFMMIVVLDGPWRLSHESSEFKLILSLHLEVGWTHTFIQWISHYGQPYKAAIFMMIVVLDGPWRLSHEFSEFKLILSLYLMLVEHILLYNGYHIMGSPMRLPFARWMLCWTALEGCHINPQG